MYIYIYTYTQRHTHIFLTYTKSEGQFPALQTRKATKKPPPTLLYMNSVQVTSPPPKSTYNANIGLARYLQNIGHQMSSEQNKVCTDQLAGRVNTYV